MRSITYLKFELVVYLSSVSLDIEVLHKVSITLNLKMIIKE